MADPLITPAIIGANCVIGLLSGPAGNASQWAILSGARRVGRVLAAGTPKQNHHLLRATHAAYVGAMRDMARICTSEALGEEETAAARSLADLAGRKAFHEFRYDGEHFPLDQANAAIDRMFGGGIADMDGGGDAAEHRAFGRAVIADLAGWGVALAPLQQRLFEEGLGDHAPWHIRFRIAFGEELIRSHEAMTIFTAERLGELRVNGIRLIDAVDRLSAAVDKGFAASAVRDAEIKGMLGELLARRGGEIEGAAISERALLRIAEKVSEHVADAGQALAEIERAVDDLLALRADAARGSNLDALVTAALRRIDLRAAAGEFDAAAQEAARAFSEWEQREAGRRDRERAVGLRFVEENIRTNRLRRDAAAVALWLARGFELDHAGAEAVWTAVEAELERLVASGRDQGINLDLEIAAALARRIAEYSDDERHRGHALVWLGIALYRLSDRHAERTALDEAIIAFRRALTIHDRVSRPLSWAMTQNNLANALAALSERCRDVRALDEAVSTYRAVLEVYTRETRPRDWARTQNNLGNVLQTTARLRHDDSMFDEAAAAYRAALEVRTRERMPIEWATTQGNLGNALQAASVGNEDTDGLREAIAAYRAALEVRTRERLPLAWATTQTNLGTALANLGARLGDASLLREAVAAHREALEVNTRERLPIDWAITQENLATALTMLAAETGERETLRQGVRAFEDALEVFRRQGFDLYRGIAEEGLARARARLAEHG